MNRIAFCLSLALISFRPLMAQSPIVEASVDSMMMWIGQQTGLHIGVTCDAGQNVEFPQFRDTIVKGLEIVPPVLIDTQYVNEGRRMTITRSYTVTCFDSALIYIPPIPVQVDGNVYESNRLALAFMAFDIPQEQEGQIYGPKENLKTPIKLYEIKGGVLYLLLLVIAVIIAFYLFVSYRDNKPVIRRIKRERKIPAHIRAIQEIEELRQAGGPRSGDAKEYYTNLTDIVREYINDRFGFYATEMTSDEILQRLEENCDRESLSDLKELLFTADMVKFAKLLPMLNENDRNLMTAMDFVNDTKIELPESELEAVEEETIIEVKRSRGARIALLTSGVILSMAGLLFFVLTILKLYYLFF